MAGSHNAGEQVRLTGAAGVGADTDIAVAGITARDCVGNSIVAADGTNYDVDNVTITEDDVIQSSDATTGKVLIICWADLREG